MGKREEKSKEKYFETPVYPSEFHTRTFPNRIYIWIIERFVSIVCILMLLTAMQSIYILTKIGSTEKSGIYFVFWDELENKFKKKEYVDESSSNKISIPIYQLAAEETLEDFITKRYEINSDEIMNEKNWCGCSEKFTEQKQQNMFSKDCFVCNHSSGDEWKNFENGLLQHNIDVMKEGKTRKVVLLESEILNFHDAYIREKDSIMNKIAKIAMTFIGMGKKQETFLAQYIMEVKFALIQYNKNGSVEWTEMLSGIAQITSKSKDYEDRIYGFVIDEFDANFIPQKESYKIKYLKELKKYE